MKTKVYIHIVLLILLLAQFPNAQAAQHSLTDYLPSKKTLIYTASLLGLGAFGKHYFQKKRQAEVRDQLMNSLNDDIYQPIGITQWNEFLASLPDEKIKKLLNSNIITGKLLWNQEKKDFIPQDIQPSTISGSSLELIKNDTYLEDIPKEILQTISKYDQPKIITNSESFFKLNPLWLTPDSNKVIWITEKNLAHAIPYIFPLFGNFYITHDYVGYRSRARYTGNNVNYFSKGAVAKFFDIYFKLLPLLANKILPITSGALMEDYVGRPGPELLNTFSDDTHYFPIKKSTYTALLQRVPTVSLNTIDPTKISLDALKQKLSITKLQDNIPTSLWTLFKKWVTRSKENDDLVYRLLLQQKPKMYAAIEYNEPSIWTTERSLINAFFNTAKEGLMVNDDENLNVLIELYSTIIKEKHKIHKIPLPLKHYEQGCVLCRDDSVSKEFLYYSYKEHIERMSMWF